MEGNSTEVSPPIASDTFFQHTPLDLTRKQVRLLRLIETDSEEIQCELEDFTYEINGKQDIPPYWALSYVWGTKSPVYHIIINGKAYPILPNLHDFLQERRLQNNNNYLWIDQICIDQHSVDERNHQVSQMSEIYRNADGVIVWLGKRDEEVELGIRCFQEYQNIYHCDLSEFLHLPAETTAGRGNIGKWIDTDHKLKEEVVQSINALYKNPFWTRLWIVQEVLLARTVLAQQGSLCFRLDAISRFELFRPRCDGLDCPPVVVYTARHPGAIPLRARDLKWMISEFYDFGCHDPRDKVYGLLGVVESGVIVHVDYRKSAEEVFIDVIFAFLDRRTYESEEPNELRKEFQRDVQILYDLVINMIPDKVEKFFEKNDQDRWRFRQEDLKEWRTKGQGKNYE